MVTANIEIPVHRGEQAARSLGTACAGLFVALPLVVLAANRAAPLMVTLSALCGLGSVIAGGQGAALRDELLRAARHPAGLSGLALLSFALISMLWSAEPLASMRFFGELMVSLAAGTILAFVLPRAAPRATLVWLGGALAIAACFIAFDLSSDMSLHRALAFSNRSQAFFYNRPAIILLLLALPALFALWSRGRLWIAAAIGLAVLTAMALLIADSGAAVLGAVIALPVFVLALVLKRAMRWLAIAAFTLVLATAPVFGTLADCVLPARTYDALAAAHSRDRVEIWQTFGAAVALRPLTGYGFGSSAFLNQDARAQKIAPKHRELLAVGHPHDSFLQVWVEMGFFGALLAFFVSLTGISALAAGAGRAAPFAFAALAAASGIALVGHGAWQGWWIATLGATIAAFRLALVQAPPSKSRRAIAYGRTRSDPSLSGEGGPPGPGGVCSDLNPDRPVQTPSVSLAADTSPNASRACPTCAPICRSRASPRSVGRIAAEPFNSTSDSPRNSKDRHDG